MKHNRFELETFLNNEKEVFHVARTTINSKDVIQLHKHGYAEVLWIKSGSGIHLVNGEEVPLSKETLCMIRPDDIHTFKLGKNQDRLVITNIAFYEESLRFFKERYFPDSDSYFWSTDKLPFCIKLETDHLNELSAIVDRLISQPRDYIHLDYIMITIFRLINSIEGEQLHIPHWLAFALENFNIPDKFKNGIQGFVELTKRSTDHVNRILQKHLKQTLTETVVKARLQYASQQLIMTNSSIKSICFDCGFNSISYSYRIFKTYTGQTPVEYRKKNHKIF